jgi:hypothetical protein
MDRPDYYSSDAEFQAAVEKARGGKRSKPSPEGGASAAIQAPAFSDEALALLFAQRHASDLRYVSVGEVAVVDWDTLAI